MEATLAKLTSTARARSRRFFVGGSLTGLARVTRALPRAAPSRHGVEVVHDIPYRDGGHPEHVLDVYRPVGSQANSPLPPALLYIHGGGFTHLSKDTHWVMALAFARAGYTVFNISYRLAPEHPYPAALEDACAAYEWIIANAKEHGGDPTRLIVAGESAGGNLATSLTIATCYERPEPFAAAVFATGVVPIAALPLCPILDVSRPTQRFARRKLPLAVRSVISGLASDYLREATPHPSGGIELADPVVFLERNSQPARPLPAMFASVGTRDPLLDDIRRLHAAVTAAGGSCEADFVPGEPHAFQAFVWRSESRRFWRRAYRFLAEATRDFSSHTDLRADSSAIR